MKSFALALVLGLSTTAAFAQSGAAPAPAPERAAETTVVTPEAPSTAVRDTGCIRDTGTRLRKRDRNGCTGGPGQSYSREDLERTGGTDTSDVLRRLNPSVSLDRGG
jgi:hypothetical protein